MSVVSLGPGDSRYLAPEARYALEQARVIVGYKTYLNLVDAELLKGKEIISTGMTGEIKRCRMAIDKALEGGDTAVISSGDAGIYGMAGLVLELVAEQGLSDRLEIEVIPGIPTLSAAAALLGAPLMHDFAVISLSDLMTPWEEIRTRVTAAAETDFVLVLYNPRSARRDWQLEAVLELVVKHRDKDTPVGLVRNAARQEESKTLTTISGLNATDVDMLSIIFVGNSRTRIIGDRMVTPRGYMEKYGRV